MTLDIATIVFLLLMITGALGVIFFVAWLKHRREVYVRSALAGEIIAVGMALILLRGMIPDRLSIDVANALTLFGLGIAWSAVRRFEGQAAPMWLVLAGGIVWLVACLSRSSTIRWLTGWLSNPGSQPPILSAPPTNSCAVARRC